MLAIAYHNLGSEEDFLGNLDGALQAFYKAFKLGEENLNDARVVEKFKASYEEARDRLIKANYRHVQHQKLNPQSPPRNNKYDNTKIIVKRPPSVGKQNLIQKVYM